ncbi:DNA-directed RNA polymerases I, II, and III subunit RPABC1-like [Glycine max]|uniref:DNA-directed RNA polymerases I, II, and III subunit RPABC1-like n=1 Tax=Glycine max TaxID=3847 RepID=UPI0003DE74D6|nr:DNA-directed RNA polymerases I, II, and III subunit RPABC1-like [Glycine max]|eukprot:XP_006591631.1 DNA-directed RNA polymerases I, II, and III subunit RPABC1-like [Glycine max]
MAISQALPTSQATSKIVRGLSFESAKSTKLGTRAPTKKVKKSKRSIVVANVGFSKTTNICVVASVDKVSQQQGDTRVGDKAKVISPSTRINIRKHVLQQPKNEILTDDEGESPLTKFNLEEMQLPRMSKTNDIARYYWLEKGQVIKITRSRPGVDSQYESYRCVV